MTADRITRQRRASPTDLELLDCPTQEVLYD